MPVEMERSRGRPGSVPLLLLALADREALQLQTEDVQPPNRQRTLFSVGEEGLRVCVWVCGFALARCVPNTIFTGSEDILGLGSGSGSS